MLNIVLGAAVVGTVLTGGMAEDTVAAPEASAAGACSGQKACWVGIAQYGMIRA